MAGMLICRGLGISKKGHGKADSMSGKVFMKSTDLSWGLELGSIMTEKVNTF